jgi:hypothetical protein
MEAGKKKQGVQIGIFIITFVVAFFGTKWVMSQFKSSHSELKNAAVELNKMCPKMIDPATRIDSAVAIDNSLQYHYTLVAIDKAVSTIPLDEARQFCEKNAQTNLDTNPNMDFYRKNNVSLEYHYRDKKGKPLFQFTIHTLKNKK